jgi:phosphodiesterase/alkaline phosphatase D-like protein
MSTTSIRFAHGVASGDPYADSVILWTRISPAAGFVGSQNVQWEIASSADFAPVSIQGSGSFTTSSARDWTVKVEAAGLRADTTYFYRFRAEDGVSSVGQTKTLPVGSDPVRLAVLSCANFPAAQQFDAYARAAVINSANPYDAWLQVGDYIYEYGPGGYGTAEDAAGSRGFLPNREILSLDDYRQRYAQYHTDPGLQALRAAAPLIAIWDDHETANDSWQGGAENHQSATEGDWIARRDAALKAYYEWIPIREPGLRQLSDGATASSPLTQGYRSFSFGEVLALHMLETRLTARDEQLEYPDAAAVQARIGAILADPALVASYATKAGIAPPTSAEAIPAFATALAPLVSQELVIAIVQKAWGDPNRDLIGDTQMAWLQQQLASSSAAWQMLGQQVLMQSMAVPTELLLNAGNPALLDKYAGPLQKLATGTPFASLPPAEQALFAEAGKIPYNLDAWDGYGVERETILQTALALGKRLISLAGDTHNAWAGVLDTMSAGSKPAGKVAGVEFATPGVTSPGLEKYLPGADAYIRASYPAVDGLDGLFLGYVNGLKYADLNRRGFLDLTVSKEQAVGSFQFLNGTDAVSGQPLWSSQSVVSSASYELRPLITWQTGWRELDLNFGLAFDATGASTRLDPTAYASVPRDGVQLADVWVQGSPEAERVVVGAGATVEAGAGSDELDNTDSRGGNLLAGGIGTDRFLLRAAGDRVIGGDLLANASDLGLPPVVGLVDGERDVFLIDSSNPSPEGTLAILDFELGRDELLLDGLAPTGSWSTVRQLLQGLGITVNAAPQLGAPLITLSLQPGVEESRDLGSLASDPDGNPLQLVKLDGPAWVTTSGTTVKATAPIGISEEQLAALTLRLAFSDGQAAVPLAVQLTLNKAPSALTLANSVSSLAENSSTASRIKVADIVITDDASGSNTISLSGADAASFEVSGNALFLKAGTALNFEAKASYAVSVSASDPSLPGSTPVSTAFALAVTDVNEPPTAITLSLNTILEIIFDGTSVKVGSLPENTSTTNHIKVAEILISDDALGSNVIELSGADASSFEVIGTGLFLKAGTTLDFETKSAFNVIVSVRDPALTGTLGLITAFQLVVRDVNEDPLGAFVTAPGAGSNSMIQLRDVKGNLMKQFNAFPGFNGSVSVAYGDLNNDGVKDIVAGAGPGGGPHVKAFDGLSGNEIASFFAYDASFRGGVNVAVGDLNGDGRLELITGAGAGGGPHVKAFALNFSAGRATTQEVASFFAYAPSFSGGVSVAAGDVNGDGAFDIITGAGPGGGPHVKAFGFGAPAPALGARQELASFYAYDANFRGGVSVASGNINGLGPDEIITGAGAGGGPHVKAFSRSTEGTLNTVSSFFAYDPSFRGGVEVGSMMSPSNLAVSRVLTGAGPGGGPHVRGFDLSNPLGQPNEVLSFYAESPAFRAGVAVS